MTGEGKVLSLEQFGEVARGEIQTVTFINQATHPTAEEGHETGYTDGVFQTRFSKAFRDQGLLDEGLNMAMNGPEVTMELPPGQDPTVFVQGVLEQTGIMDCRFDIGAPV